MAFHEHWSLQLGWGYTVSDVLAATSGLGLQIKDLKLSGLTRRNAFGRIIEHNGGRRAMPRLESTLRLLLCFLFDVNNQVVPQDTQERWLPSCVQEKGYSGDSRLCVRYYVDDRAYEDPSQQRKFLTVKKKGENGYRTYTKKQMS